VTAYLRPTAAIAPDALLPADPGIAMRLAQALIASPRMSNHHHGLWGYGGRSADGGQLTVQSTGIGGPSAAAVLTELAANGVRRAIRVGIARALDPELVGAVVIAGAALCEDGTSRAYGAGTEVEPDPTLTAALGGRAGAEPALVASHDVEVEPLSEHGGALRAKGAVAVDLETAALFAVGRAQDVAVAAALIACAAAEPADERLERELIELGPLCVGALARAQAAADVG
jgi:uridine phosphorylase